MEHSNRGFKASTQNRAIAVYCNPVDCPSWCTIPSIQDWSRMLLSRRRNSRKFHNTDAWTRNDSNWLDGGPTLPTLISSYHMSRVWKWKANIELARFSRRKKKETAGKGICGNIYLPFWHAKIHLCERRDISHGVCSGDTERFVKGNIEDMKVMWLNETGENLVMGGNICRRKQMVPEKSSG